MILDNVRANVIYVKSKWLKRVVSVLTLLCVNVVNDKLCCYAMYLIVNTLSVLIGYCVCLQPWLSSI